jgi:MATE family multidrug resistance protein
MTLTAAAFISFPGLFAGIYTENAEVLLLATTLLPIAGVFQVFDGIQVVSVGLLRGLGDTRIPMIVSMLGFWFVGMPVSLGLAFGLGLGAVGLWWGLVVGLGMVSLFLVLRIKHREERDLTRIIIDEHSQSHRVPDHNATD